MRYRLATVLLLLAAPLAAQIPTTALDAVAAGLTIANLEDCEADDVLAVEDGKLWCRQPIDFAAVDITAESTADPYLDCREPYCRIEPANFTIDYSEFTFEGSDIHRETVLHDPALVLTLDGSLQLIVNGAPYTCTPEEERR